MTTSEVEDCLERLRGLQQCLDAVLDSPGHSGPIGCAVFFSTELHRAIEDLDRHLPHANDLKPEANERATSWPEDMKDDRKG